MNTSTTLVCSMLALLLLAAAPATSPTDPVQSLNGSWSIVRAEMSGTVSADQFWKSVTLTLSPGKYLLTTGGPADEGKLTVDPKSMPMRMRIDGTAGPNKGKT